MKIMSTFSYLIETNRVIKKNNDYISTFFIIYNARHCKVSYNIINVSNLIYIFNINYKNYWRKKVMYFKVTTKNDY